MKAVSFKLKEKQLKLLDQVSKQTSIPKSALIRQGIEMILRHYKEDVISADLRHEIDQLIKEDQGLLNKLA